jgi:tetratricopeptide (TPR) repeat protein
MRALLFFIFLNLTFIAFSQNLDSLKREVEKAPDSERFEMILSYMRRLLNSDATSSFKVSQYAVEFAYNSGDSLVITKSLYAQGFLQHRLEKETQAITTLNKARDIAKRNNQLEELSKIFNLLAVAHTYTANYGEALKSNFESLTVNEKRSNQEGIGISLNNIGLVYFKLRNFDESIKYYKKSLDIKKRSGSTFDLDRLYINMALCFNQLEDYEAAEESINNAFSICGEKCSDDILIEAEHGLGVSLLQRKRAEESKVHFEKSLKKARQLGNKRFEIENLSNIASVYLALGDAKIALSYLNEAEVAAKSVEYLQPLMDLYKKFSSIYEEMEDYKNSSVYSKRYSNLRDSVLSEEMIKNLADVQTKFAERENLATISIKQQTIEQQILIIVLVSVVTVSIMAVAVLLCRNNRLRHQANALLESKVQERTRQLQESHQALLQQARGQTETLTRAYSELRSFMATLRGLVHLSQARSDDEGKKYLAEAENTLGKAENTAKKYLGKEQH